MRCLEYRIWDIKIQQREYQLWLRYNFKMRFRECPVLRPTAKEFNNFYEFVHKLDSSYKQKHGMVKVIPPPEWRPHSFNYQQQVNKIVIRSPIEQVVHGTNGFYEVKNIVQDKMSYKAYCRHAEAEGTNVAGKNTDEKEQLVHVKFTKFWKTLTYSSPLYGADLTATLMDQTAGQWNMNNLNSILKHAISNRLRGVNQPYCYIGSWKAFFSWHKEDLDLSAINYIHQGESKVWYSIAASDSHILEKEANKHFKTNYEECQQFLRHKTTLINPKVLLSKYPKLNITRVEQQQNDIMLVFGGAYHCGFNCGLNIAEAVNYATQDWLQQLVDARYCKCSKHSVKGQREAILYSLENSPIFERLAFNKKFIKLQEAVAIEQALDQQSLLYQQPQQNKYILPQQTIKKHIQVKQIDHSDTIIIEKSSDVALIQLKSVKLKQKTKMIVKNDKKGKKMDIEYKPRACTMSRAS